MDQGVPLPKRNVTREFFETVKAHLNEFPQELVFDQTYRFIPRGPEGIYNFYNMSGSGENRKAIMQFMIQTKTESGEMLRVILYYTRDDSGRIIMNEGYLRTELGHKALADTNGNGLFDDECEKVEWPFGSNESCGGSGFMYSTERGKKAQSDFESQATELMNYIANYQPPR